MAIVVHQATSVVQPAANPAGPSLWERARARVYGEVEQRQLGTLGDKLTHRQLAAAMLEECKGENKYQWYPSLCNKCGAAMLSAACTHTGGNAAKREIGGVTLSAGGAKYTRGEIKQGKLTLRTKCGNCNQKVEIAANEAVLVGDFAGLLAEAFRQDPAKLLAAANAGLRGEQQGLFDSIMKLKYVTREQKARAVSLPVMTHSNLTGVACRITPDVRATRSLSAANVVKARLGRKTTTAKKVGVMVAIPLAMIVGAVAMKMACGACCGDDHSSGATGASGGGDAAFGGAGSGGFQQAPDLYSGEGGGDTASSVSALNGASAAAAAQARFISGGFMKSIDTANSW